MQERQKNRQQYFNELAHTSEKYYVPYIQQFRKLTPGMNILEIGCGDGGNLVPFARRGCNVLGVDMAESRIRVAQESFKDLGLDGKFIASDIFKVKELEGHFELIICHDVIEHIYDKKLFIENLSKYVKPGGIVFMSFPAWYMPFGGHQQICHGKFLSHLPFFHILPAPIYKGILKLGKEEAALPELLEIKKTKCPIELFQKLIKKQGIQIMDQRYYFINPHYEVKFKMKPRLLNPLIGCIPGVRNFFTTSCFYILKP